MYFLPHYLLFAKDDISELAFHFLAKYAIKATRHEMKLSSRVIKQLMPYQWLGNVRELKHLIERSILLANGPAINQIDLPEVLNNEQIQITLDLIIKRIDEVEREHIIAVLKKYKGGWNRRSNSTAKNSDNNV